MQTDTHTRLSFGLVILSVCLHHGTNWGEGMSGFSNP